MRRVDDSVPESSIGYEGGIRRRVNLYSGTDQVFEFPPLLHKLRNPKKES